jgi:hypothetical protein
LDHEVGDDTVEDGSFVMEWFAGFAYSFFSGAECAEVFDCFGYSGAEEAEDYSSGFFSSDVYIEEYFAGDGFSFTILL